MQVVLLLLTSSMASCEKLAKCWLKLTVVQAWDVAFYYSCCSCSFWVQSDEGECSCCCESPGLGWSWLSLWWIQLLLLQLPWVNLKMPRVERFAVAQECYCCLRQMCRDPFFSGAHNICCLLHAFIQSALQYSECIHFCVWVVQGGLWELIINPKPWQHLLAATMELSFM